MKYVCATPPQLRGWLAPHSRLYAFPAAPEPPPDEADGFVLLDSGAFGLAMHGKSITRAHMEKLAAHYLRHAAPRIHAVAPDVYLDPERSVKNWLWWRAQGYPPVVPVIQLPRVREVDLLSVRAQIVRYSAGGSHPLVCVSNPGLDGATAYRVGMDRVIDTVRAGLTPFGRGWVHVLGAGWSADDVLAWRRCGPDSIDSIAYYTAARQGERWDGQDRDPHWRVNALHNALHVRRLLHAPEQEVHHAR